MKISQVFLLLLFMVIAGNSFAQSKSFTEKRSSMHTYIKAETFEGVIFSKDFMLPFLADVTASKRFTPTVDDIERAEILLSKDIQGVNALKLNQGGIKGPVIHENLSRFVRQYFGYFTDEGDKVVYISCLLRDNYDHTPAKSARWLDGAVVVLNGGSNYWQVQANLNKKNLFGLDVNNLAAE
ncbi:MAG TPA: hypothetical protein VGD22_01985 [Sphingobacteriaceae bacterium]